MFKHLSANMLFLAIVSLIHVTAPLAYENTPLMDQPDSDWKKPLPALDFFEPNPEPMFHLPKLNLPPKPQPQLSSTAKIFVKQYRFVGNRAISDSALQTVAKNFKGRMLNNDELLELKNRLTQYYIQKGFLTSGVVLPDQKVVDGLITFNVIEGKLADIKITENRHLASGYISKRLYKGLSEPLNINELQRQIQFIHQNRHIRKVDARLLPGSRLGESELVVDVKENRPYFVSFEVDNHTAPSTGSTSGKLYCEYNTLTGWGDTLAANIGRTEGLEDYSFHYTIPLTASDMILKLSYDRNAAIIIEEPFDEIDIRSESETYHFSIKWPLFRSIATEFAVSLGVEHRRRNTWIFQDVPFAFSEGADADGQSKVSPFRLSLDWQSSGLNQVLAIRTTLSFGTQWFDATQNNDNTPDGQFTAILGQFQWMRRYDRLHNTQIIFKVDGQYAASRLLPLEKFSIGGAGSVRGYRENQLARDNSVVTSLEIRVPVFKIRLPKISHTFDDGEVQVATFYDAGWGENRSDDALSEDDPIYSAGLGVRWNPGKNLQTQIYWAHGFVEFEHKTYDLQDSGVHFLVRMNY